MYVPCCAFLEPDNVLVALCILLQRSSHARDGWESAGITINTRLVSRLDCTLAFNPCALSRDYVAVTITLTQFTALLDFSSWQGQQHAMSHLQHLSSFKRESRA